MSNLFDAQTKDVIESRMAQTLHTITEKEQSTMEGTFARDLIDANAVEFESSYAELAMLRDAAFAESVLGRLPDAAGSGIWRRSQESRQGQRRSYGDGDGRSLHHSQQSLPDKRRPAILYPGVGHHSCRCR